MILQFLKSIGSLIGIGKKPTQIQNKLPMLDLLDGEEMVIAGLLVQQSFGLPKISYAWVSEGCEVTVVKKEQRWYLACSDSYVGERLIPLRSAGKYFFPRPKESCPFRIQTSVFA